MYAGVDLHIASMLSVGAITNIRNNEKQIPYDLSAKNPEVGRLLMVRGELVWLVGGVCECFPPHVQLILVKVMGRRRIQIEPGTAYTYIEQSGLMAGCQVALNLRISCCCCCFVLHQQCVDIMIP